ncbi:MAG: sugar transferase [Myxococcota bacterium]
MGLSPPARPLWVDDPRAAAVKRVVDVVGAAILAVVGLPFVLLAAVAIVIEDGAPPWFAQVRVGRRGHPFVLFKLRTMRIDAEARKAELLDRNEVRGPAFKIRADPRVTRVGRLLRRTSIDELPQVLNVLRGEMSLVGPRPALPCEVDAYGARARQRLLVKPGLTGLWQVSGRAALPFDEWLDLDLDYVTHQSLALDLWLLVRTVPAVLGGRGAS